MQLSSSSFLSRDASHGAVLGGSIYVAGGWNGSAEFHDTWASHDALTWHLQAHTANWTARWAHSIIATSNNALLLVGGWNDLTSFNDVWITKLLPPSPEPTVAPAILGIQPLTVDCAGDTLVTLTCRGLVPNGTLLAVNGTTRPAIIVSPSRLDFIAPSWPASFEYVPVSVGVCVGANCSAERGDLLYYACSCTQQGWFFYRGVCDRCPSGAYCPGGPRAWPYENYWSTDEGSWPNACALINACPGAMDQWSDYPHRVQDDGSRVTSQCANGYEGELCGQCALGFYLADRICRTCGIDTDDARELITVLFAAGVFIVLMALGVVFLDDVKLARLVQGMVAVQQLLSLSATAGNLLSADIENILTRMSFLNYSVRFVKPVCSLSGSAHICCIVGLYRASPQLRRSVLGNACHDGSNGGGVCSCLGSLRVSDSEICW